MSSSNLPIQRAPNRHASRRKVGAVSDDVLLSTADVPSPQERNNRHFQAYGEPLNYSVDAAAWAIGIGKSTLWAMIKDKLVQTVKIGRRRLIPKEEVHRIKSGTR